MASIGLFSGFSLLASVVPLWVVANGGGEFAAGASTGVFMASTVGAQLLMTRLVARFGYRATSVAGALFLGVPAALLPWATTWQEILALSLLRGIGFGILTVCGSALIAELLPVEALGRGSGLYGLAVGVPLLVGLAAGVLVAQRIGFAPVFFTGAGLPLVAILPLLLLPPVRHRTGATGGSIGDLVRVVWRVWLPMACGSVAFGALLTFLPLVFAQNPSAGAAALLAMSAAALGARWWTGVRGDRTASAGRFLPAGLALTGLGLLGFALTATVGGPLGALVAVAFVALYGAGFGVVQNDSLVAMFSRESAARASVAWNVAFDAGQGAGAVAVGVLVAQAGYTVAFAVLAACALLLMPVVLRPH